MANITAKDLHDLIFNDGRLYGNDGANHLCNYTDEQRIQLIDEYVQSKLQPQANESELIEFVLKQRAYNWIDYEDKMEIEKLLNQFRNRQNNKR